MSLQDENGRNIFAVSDEELKSGGRKGAAYEDIKYLSQEAEWFLAGLLEGLPDGQYLQHDMSRPAQTVHAQSSR